MCRPDDYPPYLEDQPPVPGGTTAIRGGQYVTEERAPGPPSPHPIDWMGHPIERHATDRDHIEADGWHCTICGQSVDFDDGHPYHDDLAIEPEDQP